MTAQFDPTGKFIPPFAPPLTGDESFVRSTMKFLKNPLEGFGPLAYRQSIVSLPTFGYKTHVISDPEGMMDVLGRHADKFSKAPIDARILAAATKEGLLSVNGDQWKRQRRGVAPIFRPRHMASLAPIITNVIDKFVIQLAGNADVELNAAMADITFDVLSKALLGDPQGIDGEQLRIATRKVVTSAGTLRPDDLLPLPRWLPRPIMPSGMRALRRLKSAADSLLDNRDPDDPGDDLVGLLISATDPHTGESLSRRERRDNLIGFFIAGHETTALTLTWSLYLCAKQSNAASRIRREVMEVAGQGPVKYEHLEKLAFTRAVIDETLRLFPPAPLLTRQCQAEVEILGRQMMPRDILILNNYIMQRADRLWENPSVFDPDRFLKNPDLKSKGSAFMPFGAGPRICVGAAFATMEAVMVLATLIRDFDISVDAECYPKPVMTVTLRPETPINATFLPMR